MKQWSELKKNDMVTKLFPFLKCGGEWLPMIARHV